MRRAALVLTVLLAGCSIGGGDESASPGLATSAPTSSQ
ncbi:MAG: hypothetical protein QOJ29_1250, partial [Thermoleophilaceae bacterium]|nr:hypothetical protein [Thermoleophilaceae bacterium]